MQFEHFRDIKVKNINKHLVLKKCPSSEQSMKLYLQSMALNA